MPKTVLGVMILLLMIATLLIEIATVAMIITDTVVSARGSRTAQATCPRCGTSEIREYFIIKPQWFTCPHCGTRTRFRRKKEKFV